jgi:hypothetical protein
LEPELVFSALRNALMMRTPERALYFHSDRGNQAVRKSLRVISPFKYEPPGKLLR